MMKKKRLIPMIAALLAIITAFSVLIASAAYLGDADMDGKVQAKDARMILRHAAKIALITDEAALALCDIDGNGKVNAADARFALRMASKAEPLIEVPETTEQLALYWVLVDSKYNESGNTDDGAHQYRVSNEGVTDGVIRVKYSGGYYGEDNPNHCTRTYECSTPPEYFPLDGTVSVNLRLVTTDFTAAREGWGTYCPGTSFELRFGMTGYPFTDKDGEYELYTGEPNNRPYVYGNVDISGSFSYQFPPAGRKAEDFNEGAGISLRWNFGGGQYEWFYELKRFKVPETTQAPETETTQAPETEPTQASETEPTQAPETTEQAELYWVLVGSEYTLSQVVNDGDHHYTPSYGGVVDGMELIWYDGGFYGSGPSHCKRGYMCSIPPEYVAQTGTISLTLRIVTEEFDVGGKEDAAVWCPGTGVQLLDGWNKIPLTDENGEDELYTGSGNNRPYVHGNVDISKTFSCTLPPNGRPADDFRAGDKITLRWSCGGGTYEWTYELKEFTVPDTTQAL